MKLQNVLQSGDGNDSLFNSQSNVTVNAFNLDFTYDNVESSASDNLFNKEVLFTEIKNATDLEYGRFIDIKGTAPVGNCSPKELSS